ncbi:MAG: hypothetical protein H6854_00110 [Rhodospirillales bacterium]|nr:hypothetical protein [Rhodospirillales bacterium]
MIKNDFPWQLTFIRGVWTWSNLIGRGFSFNEKDLSGQKILQAKDRDALGYIPFHDKNTEFGIIDPDGNFYGCESGSHMELMLSILGKNPDWNNPTRIDNGTSGFFRVYEQFAQEFSGKHYRHDMVNQTQASMLQRLGFDLRSGGRTSIPDYDDVFNEKNPAFPQLYLSYLVVTDSSEVLAWMAEVESNAQSHPQFII